MLRQLAAVLALAAASPALAQTVQDELLPQKGFTVVPNVGAVPGVTITLFNLQHECQIKADEVLAGVTLRDVALSVCNSAVADPTLQPFQLAAAYVNRGTLFVANDPERAKQDFSKAIIAAPDTAEAYLNRGAILVAEGRYQEGVNDLDKAIALGARKLEQAHYSRGIGRESLSDFKGAYADYKVAAALNPTWTEPQVELTRFTVVR